MLDAVYCKLTVFPSRWEVGYTVVHTHASSFAHLVVSDAPGSILFGVPEPLAWRNRLVVLHYGKPCNRYKGRQEYEDFC